MKWVDQTQHNTLILHPDIALIRFIIIIAKFKCLAKNTFQMSPDLTQISIHVYSHRFASL